MTLRLATLNVLLLAAAMPLLAAPAEAKQKETVVYSFGTVPDDGMNPQDGLIADRSGNLYGTTLIGGAFNKGTVFRLTPAGAETVVYSFAGAPNDGDEPNAALAIDSKGILYGTTLAGGSTGKGVVFQFDPAHGQEQVLHSFCEIDCSDGNSPIAPVTVGKKACFTARPCSAGWAPRSRTAASPSASILPAGTAPHGPRPSSTISAARPAAPTARTPPPGGCC
jgi:uncharacterized repeat protein (TIGR03803 family)